METPVTTVSPTPALAPVAWEVVLNDVAQQPVSDESRLPDLGAVNSAIDKMSGEQLRSFAHGWQTYYEVFDFGMSKALYRIKKAGFFTQYKDDQGTTLYKSWGEYVEGELKFSVSKANDLVRSYENLVVEGIKLEKFDGLSSSVIALVAKVATRKTVGELVEMVRGKPTREAKLLVDAFAEKNPAKVKANAASQQAKADQKAQEAAEKEAAKQAEIDAAVAAAFALKNAAAPEAQPGTVDDDQDEIVDGPQDVGKKTKPTNSAPATDGAEAAIKYLRSIECGDTVALVIKLFGLENVSAALAIQTNEMSTVGMHASGHA